MSINQGKYNGDLDIWGLTHNYYHEHLNHAYENIIITNNNTVASSFLNMPVIKAGTAFFLYSSDSANITSQALGNNCFPPSTTISYPNHLAVFEPIDVIGSSDSTRFNSSAVNLESTVGFSFSLLCGSVDDLSSTSIGLGCYTIRYTNNITTTYDSIKGGFYSSDGLRILARWSQVSTSSSEMKIDEIYRKDVRYNINPQTSTYTAESHDDVIILNSTVGELQDNSDGSFLGVKNTFVNTNASTATIYGDLTNNTSVQILPMAAMSFIGASTSWYIISQYSSSVITSTNVVLTNSYDTGWVENLMNGGSTPEWRNVHLSSSGTGDANINHGFNCGLDKLYFKLLISTDGTDANSFDAIPINSGIGNYGYTPYYIDDGNIKIQTGDGGIAYLNDSGSGIALTNEAYYYRIIVLKLF